MGRGVRWVLAPVLPGLAFLALMDRPAAGELRTSAQARDAAVRFRSEPGVKPPSVRVSADPDTSAGDIFLTPTNGKSGGPMILNPQGQLVWFGTVSSGIAFDLAVQRYRGQPVLTWWQAGPDENVIADRSYRTLAVVKAANGDGTDPHDFLLAGRGTAYLTATRTVQANLTSVGGPSQGKLHDYVIQKVDIRTGRLLWQWDCYGHIPLRASHLPLPKGAQPWDAFHLNSFQLLPKGRLLVSLRNTWSVYEISARTGRIRWTLGGRYSQFKRGSGTNFEWQHDARLNGHSLTLFDDASAPQEEKQSSAKELALNVARRKVTLLHRYTHAPPLLSPAQGSMQTLSNGHVFVGWGSEPDFSEYTRGGRQILSGSFALGTTSYRAYRFPWSGQPSRPPSLAIGTASHGRANVWASWNGATGVASWRVLGGAGPGKLHTLATQRRRSFETHITLHSRPGYVQVQALDAHGRVLPHGTSPAQALQ